MANSAIEQLIEILDSNLPRSILFQKNVPVLAEAFHADSMRQILQDALFRPNHEHYSIVSCTPGKALYLPDHMINMQYKLTILDKTNNQTTTTLVNARLFEDVSSCKAYLENTLLPIAARTNGRPEIKPFANPVAIVDHLKMALSVFPLDGMIPTLVEATDPHRIASLLSETLPEALAGEFLIKDVHLDLAHYGRFARCVLRYSVDGMHVATQTRHTVTVYGKVDADGLGDVTVFIISALRERLQEPNVPYRFRIPHALGYFPDLKLLLMEAIPGKPFFKELLKTWTGNGSPESRNGKTSSESQLTLEEAIRTCALIAATLHSSDIKLGPQKTLEIQVAQLREESKVIGRTFPELHAQINSWINETMAFSHAYPAMPPCFSHGDFTYTQLIFDESGGGLVDFDSICQAEPAQDLGHYLAYQRLNIIKDEDPNFPFAPEAIERLCALFLDTYIEASRGWIADEAHLRGRVAAYELISLIRLTLHSWEKMKGSRLRQTILLLEERVECQRQISLSAKNKTP
jgi:Phosphotransferase enzyme family